MSEIKKKNLVTFTVRKEHLSEKAFNALESYRKDVLEQTGGIISKSMAAVKIIEKYADMMAENK